MSRQSNKPTPLRELMEKWKADTPRRPLVAAKPQTALSTKPTTATKDRQLLRFSQAFVARRSLSEAAGSDAQVAGSSLIIINGNSTRVEFKATTDQFVKDCEEMNKDGHTVIAMAIAFD